MRFPFTSGTRDPRRRTFPATYLFLLAAILGFAACRTPDRNGSEELVRASLIADRTAVEPGGEVVLGVLLEIEPGWHVYWRYSGDAGLPTLVELSAEERLDLGPLEWPVPREFTEAGGIRVYGYEDRVLLTSHGRHVGPDQDAEGIRISARAEWLVCKTECIAGGETLTLSLPVAEAPGKLNDGVFADAHSSIPVPQNPDRPYFVVDQSGQSSRNGRYGFELKWTSQPEDVGWFPLPGEDLLVEDITVRTDGTLTRIEFTATAVGRGEPPETLDSVVGYSPSSGTRRGVVLRLPIASSAKEAGDDLE